MNSIMSLSSSQLRKAAELKEKIQSLEKAVHQLLGAPAKAAAPAAPKKKFTMSAAAKAKISAAAKARWAKINGKKAAVKKAPKARSKLSAAARAKISAAAKARWAKAKAAGKKRL
jgi:hypothetical protein